MRMSPSAPFSREVAFDAARRHSRVVRTLKVAVPALALLGTIAFVLYAWLDPFRAQEVHVNIGKLDVSGDKLTMELPHLTGFNKRQEAYNVTAKTASQRIAAPGLIDLSNLEAVITMQDKSTATIRSLNGRFDSNAEILILHDQVGVTSTRGYSADMKSATIDFKAGTVKSDEHVKVNLTSGVIQADSLNITQGGATILFKGGVTSTFHTQLKPRPPANATPAQDQTP
ncbi:LPS export ABC transporter periplasmic protein LptC [Labrys wisconsinensis]|uniref:Lipopolysaccharide export system protein LptC n=1 Tax=Labrys wisconsinensis TaxID=425677 RepID=A0ABU0J7J7_9HYPH|nr:LPS export ABC transporter periplasmic protein LptC [Labrys wisconsinensis]MDQ0470238.1 lipopolysaccharide export system protein LptC [Labrys wisconsinensis]